MPAVCIQDGSLIETEISPEPCSLCGHLTTNQPNPIHRLGETSGRICAFCKLELRGISLIGLANPISDELTHAQSGNGHSTLYVSRVQRGSSASRLAFFGGHVDSGRGRG